MLQCPCSCFEIQKPLPLPPIRNRLPLLPVSCVPLSDNSGSVGQVGGLSRENSRPAPSQCRRCRRADNRQTPDPVLPAAAPPKPQQPGVASALPCSPSAALGRTIFSTRQSVWPRGPGPYPHYTSGNHESAYMSQQTVPTYGIPSRQTMSRHTRLMPIQADTAVYRSMLIAPLAIMGPLLAVMGTSATVAGKCTGSASSVYCAAVSSSAGHCMDLSQIPRRANWQIFRAAK